METNCTPTAPEALCIAIHLNRSQINKISIYKVSNHINLYEIFKDYFQAVTAGNTRPPYDYNIQMIHTSTRNWKSSVENIYHLATILSLLGPTIMGHMRPDESWNNTDDFDSFPMNTKSTRTVEYLVHPMFNAVLHSWTPAEPPRSCNTSQRYGSRRA